MPDAQGLKHAAVCLIVADDGAGAAALVLTRRAEHLSAHSGQFALPGGRIDAGETAIEAALREAHEEIGLELAPASILGRLDDYPTRSGYVITPLVAWAPREAQMRANPGEVAAIHRIVRRSRTARLTGNFLDTGERPPGDPLSPARHHNPRAHRGLLFQFMEVAVTAAPTRVAHFDQAGLGAALAGAGQCSRLPSGVAKRAALAGLAAPMAASRRSQVGPPPMNCTASWRPPMA